MSEKKFVIPEKMLIAAVLEAANKDLHGEENVRLGRLHLRGALRWLDGELGNDSNINRYCDENFKGYDGTAQRIGFRMGIDYVRRTFLAPEPEMPEEIKDLLWKDDEYSHKDAEVSSRLAEAYRRGQQSKV